MIEQQQAPRIGLVICGKLYTPGQLEAIVRAYEAMIAPITPEEQVEGVRVATRIEARRDVMRAAIAWAWVYAASGDDRATAMCLCNAVGVFLATGGNEVTG